MPRKVFVSYRRDDERAMAARIRDRLAAAFGGANVFMDVDNLIAGQRFDRELERALTETDVFLAVIGWRWVELLDERRKSVERDYVREQIAGALKRGILVIPVLIERTLLPRADKLPGRPRLPTSRRHWDDPVPGTRRPLQELQAHQGGARSHLVGLPDGVDEGCAGKGSSQVQVLEGFQR